ARASPGASPPAPGEPPEGPGPSRVLYTEFVLSHLEAGLLPLWEEFPVLARLQGTLARTWVAEQAELVHRLADDSQALREAFGAAGDVVALSPGLSDRHNGGRRVALLAFGSGSRVLYEPRTVSGEAGWNGLLAWLSDRGAPDAPPGLRILPRDGYGWAAEAETAELPSAAAADDSFRRAGALLGAAWLFGARDLHMENVVATASGPVVVDGELTLQPERTAAAGGAATAFSRVNDRLRRSFAATGLLSLEQAFPDGRREEVGGLSGRGGYAASAPARVVTDPNSDAMALAERPATVPERPNLPRLEGRRLAAADRPEAVRKGFERMYRFLLSRRREIAAPGGPLEALGGVETRVVLRGSDLYARLLLALESPAYLRDGLSRSFAIDVLNRGAAAGRTRPPYWPLVADERAALEELDVPYFTVPAGSRLLRTRTGLAVEGVLSASGREAVRERLDAMGEEDLAAQLALLDATLLPGAAGHGAVSAPGTTPLPDAVPGIRPEELRERARRIGQRLLAEAVAGEDGSLVWIAPETLRAVGRTDRGGAYYLYDGGAGVALFLAALGRATGETRFLDAARAGCRPIDRVLGAANAARLLEHEGIGAATGLGSILWTLTAISGLLDDPSLVALARGAAAHVTPERIAAETRLDVVDGLAGAALGLLALFARTGDEELLAAAASCGDRLLSARRDAGDGRCGWPDAGGLLQAGFAHGASGIAVALARLHAATGREEFAEAAAGAVRLVESLGAPGRGGWPVLVRDGSGERRVRMTAWCHGAPGVALAHLELFAGLGDERARAVLARAIEEILETGLLPADHLCCGNAGLVDVLVQIGRTLENEELVATADRRLAAFLERADADGFRLREPGRADRLPAPGFFRGLAGIGWALLRRAEPGLLPSALAFEEPAPAAEEPVGGEAVPVLTADSEIRIEPLAPPVDPRFAPLTFPAYRHLLSLGRARRHLDMPSLPEITPVALGAFLDGAPAALLLAEVDEKKPGAAEVLSLAVLPELQGLGLGTRLLDAAAREFAGRGFERLHGVYMTGQPSQAALERVLVKCGWDPPAPRMLTIRFTLEEARRTAWFGRYPLTEGFTVFPWTELTPGEREGLVRSQAERRWIKPDLEPWRHDRYGFEPVSSLGIRYHGEIVGWVINHALSEKVVRFTCSFIRKDLGRRGKIVPAYTESIRRLSQKTAFEECTLTVPLRHEGMARFLVRWCRPMASFFGETRGSEKRLQPPASVDARGGRC
ncbi:MAG TPA: type 2 lanthipeptide synthetase LanM, partial [Thermoanaerobaculia bacterium]|nr:type 2 lanthipeptide synthetase LanM [Thermoanaerobaculia bacterium]